MGRKPVINVAVRPELKEEFYKMVAITYGVSKGSISKAIEEAIEGWLKKKKEELSMKRS